MFHFSFKGDDMIRNLLQLTIGLLALTFTAVPALAQTPGAPASFADLAEQLGPAVVNTSSSLTTSRCRRCSAASSTCPRPSTSSRNRPGK